MTYGVSKSKSFGYDSRPLTLQSNVIDKHITNSLHYFKALKDKLDAHATKSASITLRKRWIDSQKKMNYTNEYNRIRSELEQSKLKGLSTKSLQDRKDKLKELGANIVDGIVD